MATDRGYCISCIYMFIVLFIKISTQDLHKILTSSWPVPPSPVHQHGKNLTRKALLKMESPQQDFTVKGSTSGLVDHSVDFVRNILKGFVQHRIATAQR